jgi:hypothetical protein
MIKTGIVLLSLFCLLCPVFGQPNIAKQNQPSVVLIEIKTEEDSGIGSGFFISPDQVATNWHVVRNADEILMRTSDGRESSGTVWVASPQHDLALIKTSPGFGEGRSVSRRAEPAQELEPVYVCGHPEALTFSWSSGTVANANRVFDEGDRNLPGLPFIQLNAAISAGSSGGPVFDAQGKVIGVIRGDWSEGQNLNFAVPVRFLDALIAKGQNLPQTRKETWSSPEWKQWRQAMQSGGSWAEKEEAARKVFQVHGPIAMLFVDFGTAAYRANQIEIAKKSFISAVRYEPQNPRAWLGQGLVMLKEKNPEIATRKFEKALELGMQDEEVVLAACQGLERAGSQEMAIQKLKEASTRHPQWSTVREALRKVKP